MEKLIVESKRIRGRVMYRPVRVEAPRYEGKYQPLIYDGEDDRWLETHEEAERVNARYAGLDEDARAAHWDYERGEWVVSERFHDGPQTDREDFHVDG